MNTQTLEVTTTIESKLPSRLQHVLSSGDDVGDYIYEGVISETPL